MATPMRQPIRIMIDEEDDACLANCSTPATIATNVSPITPATLGGAYSVSSKPPLYQPPSALSLDSSESDDDMPITACLGPKSVGDIIKPTPIMNSNLAPIVMGEDDNSNSRPLIMYTNLGHREISGSTEQREHRVGHDDGLMRSSQGRLSLGRKRVRSEAMGRNEGDDLSAQGGHAVEIAINTGLQCTPEEEEEDEIIRRCGGTRTHVKQQFFTPTNSQMEADMHDTPLCLPSLDSREAPEDGPLPSTHRMLLQLSESSRQNQVKNASTPNSPLTTTVPIAQPVSRYVPSTQTQTHLDFGQRNIGATTCPKCGMLYNRCEEDIKLHKRFCSKVAKSEKGRSVGDKYDEAVSFEKKNFLAALKLLGTTGKPLAPVAHATIERKEYEVYMMPSIAALIAKTPALTWVRDENPFADISLNYPDSQLAIAFTSCGGSKDSSMGRVDVAFVMAFAHHRRTHEPVLVIDSVQVRPTRAMFADSSRSETDFRYALYHYQRSLNVIERTTAIDINYCFLSRKVLADNARKIPMNFFQPKASKPTPERDRRNQVGTILFELCLKAVKENAVYGVHLHECAISFSNALQNMSLRYFSPELANAINTYYDSRHTAAAEASLEDYKRALAEHEKENAALLATWTDDDEPPETVIPKCSADAYIYQCSRFHKSIPLLFEPDESSLRYNKLKVTEFFT